MKIVSYSSSKGAISVGVNFNPMYRHKIFKYELLKIFCENKIREAAERHRKRLSFSLDEVGVDIDHAHILVTFGPDTKLWQIIKAIKGYTAREIFKAFPWLRGRDEANILGRGKRTYLFTKGHFWSPGYYFESYGRRTFDDHKDYVARQGRKREDKEQTTLFNFAS